MVGNNHGKIARIDVRKGMECLLLLIEVIVFFSGTVLNRYHGFGGAVTSLSSWSDEEGGNNVFAACGLDRYLRVYRVEPPGVIHKVSLL